jgi:hypothetical protein
MIQNNNFQNLFSVSNTNNFFTLSSLKNLKYEHNDSAIIKLMKNTTAIKESKDARTYSPPKIRSNIVLIGESPNKFEFDYDYNIAKHNDLLSIKLLDEKEINNSINTFNSILNINTSNSYEKFRTLCEFQKLNNIDDMHNDILNLSPKTSFIKNKK